MFNKETKRSPKCKKVFGPGLGAVSGPGHPGHPKHTPCSARPIPAGLDLFRRSRHPSWPGIAALACTSCPLLEEMLKPAQKIPALLWHLMEGSGKGRLRTEGWL